RRQVDVARLARRDRLQRLVGDDDELVGLDLEAADEPVPDDLGVVLAAHEPPLQRRAIGSEHPQRDTARPNGREQVHRYGDESEADRPRPDRPWAAVVATGMGTGMAALLLRRSSAS